jgi:hypothetical protein
MSISKPVVQEECTGCGIASVANILGKTYPVMKAIASAMGIQASNKSLWSDTQYVRRMLSHAGVETSKDEIPFESWDALPDLALLSIKHYQEEGKDFWHWDKQAIAPRSFAMGHHWFHRDLNLFTKNSTSARTRAGTNRALGSKACSG